MCTTLCMIQPLTWVLPQNDYALYWATRTWYMCPVGRIYWTRLAVSCLMGNTFPNLCST